MSEFRSRLTQLKTPRTTCALRKRSWDTYSNSSENNPRLTLLLTSQILNGSLDLLSIRRLRIKCQIFLQFIRCLLVLLHGHVQATEILVREREVFTAIR